MLTYDIENDNIYVPKMNLEPDSFQAFHQATIMEDNAYMVGQKHIHIFNLETNNMEIEANKGLSYAKKSKSKIMK